jgi:hypothetical protein
MSAFSKPIDYRIDYRTDALFNVRIDGTDVAKEITRSAAQLLMDNRVRPSFVQVYLSDRPLEGRKTWHAQPLQRKESLKCSDAKRVKIMARLHADSDVRIETTMPCGCGYEQQGVSA